jgi:cell division septation protein DedD
MAENMHNNSFNRPEDSDEIGIGRGLRKKKSPLSLKGAGVALLIVCLVIGSFWLSFLIGKRILSPMRQAPKAEPQNIETYKIPQSLPVYDAPKAKEPKKIGPLPVKPVKKVVITKDPFFKKKKEAVKKKAEKAKKEAVKAVSDGLYKVRAAVAESKEKAVKLMKDLKDKGFDEVFAHDAGGGNYTVQAGAFKSRANAEKLLKELKEKGFDGKIITEE